MVAAKTHINTTDFKLFISHNHIELKNHVKYLGVLVGNQLSWKNHIDFLHNKLSKVCGMIYKLRHYVPLSTLKLVYYSMFNSHLQYSLLNWERATKTHYHELIILQNKIIRPCLFCPQNYKTYLLYSRFKVLKLDGMIAMEYAKFMLKTITTCFRIHIIT